MNKEAIQMLIMELTPLAEKLGTSGEFLWEVAMRQVYVSLAVSVAWILMAIIALYILCRMFVYIKDCEVFRHMDKVFLYVMCFGLITIFLLALLFPTEAHIENIIQIIVNPEWGAIEILLGLAK